jgi:hypothetical protein
MVSHAAIDIQLRRRFILWKNLHRFNTEHKQNVRFFIATHAASVAAPRLESLFWGVCSRGTERYRAMFEERLQEYNANYDRVWGPRRGSLIVSFFQPV